MTRCLRTFENRGETSDDKTKRYENGFTLLISCTLTFRMIFSHFWQNVFSEKNFAKKSKEYYFAQTTDKHLCGFAVTGIYKQTSGRIVGFESLFALSDDSSGKHPSPRVLSTTTIRYSRKLQGYATRVWINYALKTRPKMHWKMLKYAIKKKESTLSKCQSTRYMYV